MLNENLHPSDQDLLQLADGELPAHRATQIREHLAACWNCRTRMAEIEQTIGEFMRMHRQTLDPQLPPIAGPRALLKARLVELTRSARSDRRQWWRFVVNARVLALGCALAFLVVLGGRFLCRQVLRPESVPFTYTQSLPNPNFTPGATTAVAMSDICSMNHDDVVHPVPSSLQQAVFREYGMREAPAANYEIDLLISPGLGGTEDLRNLWPEPRYNTVWNSFVKDQLEDYLHQSVCGGKLSLATAQQDIATNWVSAYKKYFHTDKPLASDSKSDASRASDLLVSDLLPNACRLGLCPGWSLGQTLGRKWIGSPFLFASIECVGGFHNGLGFLAREGRCLRVRSRGSDLERCHAATPSARWLIRATKT